MNYTDTLLEIARAAGDEIMSYYQQAELEVEMKTDEVGTKSPLTQADVASHELILSRLREAYPNAGVVSEEADEAENELAFNHRECFVVDPIDGTKGFIKRDGEFTVNIGLLIDGIPTHGVVFAPAHNLMYFTDEDGAYLDDGSGPKPIHASESSAVKSAVASKSHMDETTQTFLSQFGDIELVQAGSSLKFCKVATGEADIYPRLAPTTMEWDTAAADAVLRKAGGEIVDMDGKSLAYGKPAFRNQGFVAHGPNIAFNLS